MREGGGGQGDGRGVLRTRSQRGVDGERELRLDIGRSVGSNVENDTEIFMCCSPPEHGATDSKANCAFYL